MAKRRQQHLFQDHQRMRQTAMSGEKELLRIISRVPGISAAVITDREGVAVMRVIRESVPEPALRPAFLSTPVLTSDQASKLGIGRCRVAIADFESHQVVSFNKSPFIVTIIAVRSANTGLILSLDHHFDAAIDELNRVIRPE